MPELIKIKRGVNIKLQGKSEQVYANPVTPKTYAIKPTDFPGLRLKLAVKEGDEVKAGTPVLFNKDRKEVKFCSPVSGEVVEIVRGDKRRLLEVRILADSENQYIDFGVADAQRLSRDEVKSRLLTSGCWPFIRQRPYNIVANPERTPKAIFISCFDTAPLAPDSDFIVHGLEADFQAGIDALSKLTDGKIHLGVDGKTNQSKVFTAAKGVQVNKFSGPHPAGNVGVQIHQVDPINKGDAVWVVNYWDVITIGRIFKEGKFNTERSINLAGGQVEKPVYFRTYLGAQITPFIDGNIKGGNTRYISGSVLTGTKVKSDGYLGFYDNMITAIPEGGEDQFFGWIAPNFGKFSISRTMFSWLMPNKTYNLDASMNGEERAFVMTGELEQVFPFDIYPMQLLKSIMIQDIEAMENLGIYEVVEEDFALAEVVCTSKIPLQQTVRQGLDLMLKELGD